MPLYNPPSSSSGGYSTVQDEGSALTQRSTINFTGSGVTASDSGSLTVVNIPGGGGAGASWTEIEVDFGSVPQWDFTTTITDASVSGTSKVIVLESGKPATGRASGDSLFDDIAVTANPSTGSFSLYLKANPGPVVGKRKFQYTVG